MGSTNVLGLVLAKHQVESWPSSYQINGVLKQSILDEKDSSYSGNNIICFSHTLLNGQVNSLYYLWSKINAL